MTDLQNVFLKLDEDVEGRFSQSRYMKDRRQWAKDVATLQFSYVQLHSYGFGYCWSCMSCS